MAAPVVQPQIEGVPEGLVGTPVEQIEGVPEGLTGTPVDAAKASDKVPNPNDDTVMGNIGRTTGRWVGNAVDAGMKPLLGPGKAEKEAAAVADAPPSKSDMDRPIMSGIKKGAAGMYRDAAGTLRQMVTSPIGAATLGAGELAEIPGSVGKIASTVGKAAAPLFTASGLKSLYEGGKDVVEHGWNPQNVESTLGGSGTAALGGAATLHPLISGPRTIDPRLGGSHYTEPSVGAPDTTAGPSKMGRVPYAGPEHILEPEVPEQAITPEITAQVAAEQGIRPVTRHAPIPENSRINRLDVVENAEPKPIVPSQGQTLEMPGGTVRPAKPLALPAAPPTEVAAPAPEPVPEVKAEESGDLKTLKAVKGQVVDTDPQGLKKQLEAALTENTAPKIEGAPEGLKPIPIAKAETAAEPMVKTEEPGKIIDKAKAQAHADEGLENATKKRAAEVAEKHPVKPVGLFKEPFEQPPVAEAKAPVKADQTFYHGANAEGTKAIEREGAIKPASLTQAHLTPDKGTAEAYAKANGGKVFSVNEKDIPAEVLKQYKDTGRGPMVLNSEHNVPIVKAGKETVGTAEGAKADTDFFAKAKAEKGEGASISEVAQRAQELKDEANAPKVDHKAIADAHNEHSGFTYNPKEGLVRDKPVFSAAGEYPDAEQVIKGRKVTEDQVREFAERPEVKKALAADPRNSIGGWNYKGNTHLEISKLFHDQAEAIAEGKRLNQDSIYDHAKREGIPTGGTAAEEAAAKADVTPTEEPKVEEPKLEETAQRGLEHRIGAEAAADKSPEGIDRAQRLVKGTNADYATWANKNGPEKPGGGDWEAKDFSKAGMGIKEVHPLKKLIIDHAIKNVPHKEFMADSEGWGPKAEKEPTPIERMAAPSGGSQGATEEKPKLEYKYNPNFGETNQGYTVTTRDASGKKIGELSAQETAPKELTTRSNQVYNKENRGKGYGKAQIEKLFSEAAANNDIHTVKSDISTTAEAQRVWKSLEKDYPSAITHKTYADGRKQWSADLTKLYPSAKMKPSTGNALDKYR